MHFLESRFPNRPQCAAAAGCEEKCSSVALRLLGRAQQGGCMCMYVNIYIYTHKYNIRILC